jgi:hypothetical protein
MKFLKFIIICGHYGCGKTNFSINLALNLKESGRDVTLVDLDVVNPYFRSSDYKKVLDQHGVQLIAPSFAHSNLDLPSLPSEINSIFVDNKKTIIIDLGGDDAGARVLGRFKSQIEQIKDEYQMLYLINKYRPLTSDVCDTAELLHEIEVVSRLKATGIVNNSHLKHETTANDIINSIRYSKEISNILNLPICLTTVPENLQDELNGKLENIYPVRTFAPLEW